MGLVYECASEVPGDSCVLMGTGQAAQTPAETLAAFRRFYPGKNQDTIQHCIVHQWWKEEPLALNCERPPFPAWPAGKYLAAPHPAAGPAPFRRCHLRYPSVGSGRRDAFCQTHGQSDS
jgi:hypothetical protein